jgi:hypothetical protein
MRAVRTLDRAAIKRGLTADRRGKTKPKLGARPIIFRREPISDIVNTLGSAATALPLISLGGAAWETLDLSEGICVAVQQYRAPSGRSSVELELVSASGGLTGTVAPCGPVVPAPRPLDTGPDCHDSTEPSAASS